MLSGREDYAVTGGSATFDGHDLLAMAPEERAAAGVFLAFQYPVELPGVGNANFLRTALNALRRSRGESELDAVQFLKMARAETKRLAMPDDMLRRNVNVGFSGGEKKRNEVLQMAILRPKLAILDETDSGLDIDALKIVADGVNALRGPDFSALVITHYQRLLEHIVPDRVHVLAVDGSSVRAAPNWRTNWKPRATPAWSRRRHDRPSSLHRRLPDRTSDWRRLPGDPAARPAAADACRAPHMRRARRHFRRAREEAWKYTSLRPWPMRRSRNRSPAAPTTQRCWRDCRASMRRASCSSMVQFRPELSALPAPVGFARFADQGAFGTLARPDSEPLVALNTMLAEDGASLTIPAGVDAGLLLLVSLARPMRPRSTRVIRSTWRRGAADAVGIVARRRRISAQSGHRDRAWRKTPR